MATKSNKNVNNMSKNNETKLVCPKCGAEFEIAEHEHSCENVTVIGADSNLGTVYMKLKNRKEQLASAGIDINKYFSMTTPSGEERLMKWENDIPVAVTADDPVMKAIVDGGTVPNRDLFRRWVMAQVFRGLSDKYSNGFTDWVHHKGYEYSWKMAVEEFRVQAKLEGKDKENFKLRNRWFNSQVALCMMGDYLRKLEKVIEGKPRHRCKGVPYICIGGENVFESDLGRKILYPLYSIKNKLESGNLHGTTTPKSLYETVRTFNSKKIQLEWRTQVSPVWMDAYKGAGAYYTMKNMIMFHGCHFVNDSGKWMTKSSSLMYLDGKADEYKEEGWRLFGVLRKFIKDNNFDIEAKRREWAEKKRG